MLKSSTLGGSKVLRRSRTFQLSLRNGLQINKYLKHHFPFLIIYFLEKLKITLFKLPHCLQK